jgi:RimJ/RimL family protein N-acetyltransferase
MSIEFETARCRLRPFRVTDLQAFAAYRSDPEVARYQSWSSYSHDEAVALYEDLAGKPFGLSGHWYQIAVADKANDHLLGDVALHFLDAQSVEVGFTMSPGVQRQGYGREALLGLVNHVFSALGCERISAVTDVRNTASIRVLESVGFERLPQVRPVEFKGHSGQEYDYLLSRDQWLRREGI